MSEEQRDLTGLLIERVHTLATRILDLEALVESAYREGFNDGYDDVRPGHANAGWEYSEAKMNLEQIND